MLVHDLIRKPVPTFSGSCTPKKAVECPIPSSSISAGAGALAWRQPCVTLRAQRNLRSNSPSITGSTTSSGSGARSSRSPTAPRSRASTGSRSGSEHIGRLTGRRPAIVRRPAAPAASCCSYCRSAVDAGRGPPADLARQRAVRLQRPAAGARLRARIDARALSRAVERRSARGCNAGRGTLTTSSSSTKMPERSAVRVAAQSVHRRSVPFPIRAAPMSTACPATWDEFYTAKRSSATRRRDRTKRKRLGEFGEVRFVTPQERGGDRRTLDTLIEQKTALVRPHGRRQHVRAAGLQRVLRALSRPERMRAPGSRQPARRRAELAAINLGLDLPRLLLSRAGELRRRRDRRGSDRRRAPARPAALRDRARAASVSTSPSATSATSANGPTARSCSTTMFAAASARGLPAGGDGAWVARLKRFIKQNAALWSVFTACARRSDRNPRRLPPRTTRPSPSASRRRSRRNSSIQKILSVVVPERREAARM